MWHIKGINWFYYQNGKTSRCELLAVLGTSAGRLNQTHQNVCMIYNIKIIAYGWRLWQWL